MGTICCTPDVCRADQGRTQAVVRSSSDWSTLVHQVQTLAGSVIRSMADQSEPVVVDDQHIFEDVSYVPVD